MQIGIGMSVKYVLTADDAEKINRRRTNGGSIAERIQNSFKPVSIDHVTELKLPDTWPIGAQAHIGNLAVEGQEFAMIVTNLLLTDTGLKINGQVFLDGNDVFWAQGIVQDTADGAKQTPGTWAWFPPLNI